MSPNGNYLVWLQREAGAVPHHNVHKLMLRDLRVEDHVILFLINNYINYKSRIKLREISSI